MEIIGDGNKAFFSKIKMNVNNHQLFFKKGNNLKYKFFPCHIQEVGFTT